MDIVCRASSIGSNEHRLTSHNWAGDVGFGVGSGGPLSGAALRMGKKQYSQDKQPALSETSNIGA